MADLYHEGNRRWQDQFDTRRLADRVGQTFTGTVIDVDRDKQQGRLMITEPAIEARVLGDQLRLGQEVLARLTSADYAGGALVFEVTR